MQTHVNTQVTSDLGILSRQEVTLPILSPRRGPHIADSWQQYNVKPLCGCTAVIERLILSDTTQPRTDCRLQNKDTNGLQLDYCLIYQLTFIIIQAGVKANKYCFLRNTKIGCTRAEQKSQ
jgi:hypothetical protein